MNENSRGNSLVPANTESRSNEMPVRTGMNEGENVMPLICRFRFKIAAEAINRCLSANTTSVESPFIKLSIICFFTSLLLSTMSPELSVPSSNPVQLRLVPISCCTSALRNRYCAKTSKNLLSTWIMPESFENSSDFHFSFAFI